MIFMNKNEEKYNYNNIIEEILNKDINPIDDENLTDIYKQKMDYNKLKQASSFQGIQDILRQMRKNTNLDNYSSTPLSNQKPVSQASSQAIPTTQTDLQRAANIPSPTSNGSSLQGITINFRNRLWGSPRDYSGTVYQFNRGAIGISGDGKIATSIIDRTVLHHDDATRQVSSELGFPSNRLNSTPFEAGEEAAQNGIVLIQLEGASALIYLPDEIQEEQQSSLKEVLEPRQGFEISFTHQGQIYTDNVTLDSLLQYTSSYIQIPAMTR